MRILALDIATRTGWAYGPAGEPPRSGAVKLRKPDDPLHVASSNVGYFIKDQRVLERIDMVVYEAPLDPQAKFQMVNKGGRAQNSASIILPFMIMGVIEFYCHFYGIQCVASNRQTVLKHFTGQARWGNREAAKAAVISRAHALGLLPKESRDDDRADAIAIHDYASMRWGKAQPRTLVMFGGP